MSNLMDVVFKPDLYLDRDKRAIAFVEDRLLHQDSCAAVCMYGNGKDYLFANVVKRFEQKQLAYKLKVLNTVSSDELKDFADMLEADTRPTLCLVNLRIGKDVSWFIQTIERLRMTRGYGFVSFINAYVGDVYQALQTNAEPVVRSLTTLQRVPYDDARHMIDELARRFDFYPSDKQARDIYHWSYGYIGLIRTLFLLKRDAPDAPFTQAGLLREPTVLERLQSILSDLPAGLLRAIDARRLSFIEQAFLENFGYIDARGELFHPLLAPLVPGKPVQSSTSFSPTELRVLDYLRGRPDIVVSRDDIACIVWGEEEWEDKYSDWAIGQLIYRLRKKLEYADGPGTIQTRKGQGFVYAALATGK